MRYFIFVFCFLFLISSLPAEITPIPEREYFTTLNDLIHSAKTSIEIQMYLIHSNSKEVRALLDELSRARQRGVKVSILLEDSQQENRLTAEYLKEKGVKVTFDSPDTKLHAKKVLIDQRLLLIGSSNWTKSAFTKNNESNVLVDLLEDRDKIRVLEKDYADTLIQAIDSARESLDIVIYSFQFVNDEDNKTYKLLESLLKAYDQGCRVRIVLDSWEEGESSNEAVYRLLEQAGVDVYYDLDSIASHNKLVIIDNTTVFLGSANWTETGLTENREASIMIRDAAASKIYWAYIDTLINTLPEKSIKRVPIPVSFFQKGGLFRQHYIKGGITCIKFYTWFIWEAFNKGSFTLERDYKKWYEAVYNKPALPWSVAKSECVSDLIKDLEKTGAIKRENMGRQILLVDMIENTEKWTDEDYIFVSPKLWTAGWIGKLSGRGLYFYFINLLEFKNSPYKPMWTKSRERLSWKYGMGKRSISAAIKELMAYNLIEVRHDIPDIGQPFSKRKTSRYLINDIWSEEELENKWNQLSERHGLDLLSRARALAVQINEPCDPDVVSSFIILIGMYGEELVNKAIDRATTLSFEDGKWEMRYIIGILKSEYDAVEHP